MSYKAIAYLGASTTNGYWDHPFEGWAGRLTKKLSADRPYAIGATNLAGDGDRICDMYHRLCAGVVSLQQIDVLVVAGTSNDAVRWHQPDGQLEMSLTMREEYWRRLLGTAQKNIAQVFVTGVIPIDESLFPFTGTNNWKYWTLNQDIVEYNQQVEQICREMDIPFLDFIPYCQRIDWNSMLYDGDHPNAVGHEFLANRAYEWLKTRI